MHVLLSGSSSSSGEDVSDGTTGAIDDDGAVLRAATEAQRRRLMALRADGTIGDATIQRIEEELDWAELGWAQAVDSGSQPPTR